MQRFLSDVVSDADTNTLYNDEVKKESKPFDNSSASLSQNQPKRLPPEILEELNASNSAGTPAFYKLPPEILEEFIYRNSPDRFLLPPDNPEILEEIIYSNSQNFPTKNQLPENSEWENSLCNLQLLPQNNYEGLFCKTKKNATCALFSDGKPFFCYEDTPQGKTTYQTNPWGSSITRTQYGADGKILSLFYFAYNVLRREEEYNYEKDLITRIWWENQQIRLTQTNTKGRTLNKYYFQLNGKYILYPDGNDMAETQGYWHQEGRNLIVDNQVFYALPERFSVPDICKLFDGICTLTPIQP